MHERNTAIVVLYWSNKSFLLLLLLWPKNLINKGLKKLNLIKQLYCNASTTDKIAI